MNTARFRAYCCQRLEASRIPMEPLERPDTIEPAAGAKVTCDLRLIDLNNEEEYRLLQAQRKQCGWHYEDAYLNNWRDQAVTGIKCLFWITTPSPVANASPVFAGHISLESASDDPQHELARADKSLLTISTFFVLPEFRAKGIGRQAMVQLESLARSEPFGSPRCAAITIMALSCRYVEDSAMKALYVEWTGEEPMSYERWYAKMGYKKWKEEACTEVVKPDGRTLMLTESFMKKILADFE